MADAARPADWIRQWQWKREALPDRDRFRRPYLYPFGDSESPTELTIKQRPFGPEGFASTVWDSAIVLSKYFERLGSSVLSGKRVIELGAGCGLVTVVAARLGADCTATDMEPNLPLLDENCTLNAKGGPCPRLLPLSWGRAETEAFVAATHGSADSSRAGGGGGGYDVVVGTDLMYIDGAVGALVETLDVLCPDGSRTVVYLAYGRNRWAEGPFLERARRVFRVEEVPGSELDELYQCPDVTVLRLTKPPEKAA